MHSSSKRLPSSVMLSVAIAGRDTRAEQPDHWSASRIGQTRLYNIAVEVRKEGLFVIYLAFRLVVSLSPKALAQRGCGWVRLPIGRSDDEA